MKFICHIYLRSLLFLNNNLYKAHAFYQAQTKSSDDVVWNLFFQVGKCSVELEKIQISMLKSLMKKQWHPERYQHFIYRLDYKAPILDKQVTKVIANKSSMTLTVGQINVQVMYLQYSRISHCIGSLFSIYFQRTCLNRNIDIEQQFFSQIPLFLLDQGS